MINILNYFKSAPSPLIWHSHPGSKSEVLITAGIDGDEYAGIEAANYLIKSYKGSTPITIIPIVNILGNMAGVSWNPLDLKYPKYIFPGSKYGCSTSKLMFKVMNLATQSILWIDLHGGSTNEHLNPFIWAGKSGNLNIDSFTTNLLTYLPGPILYESKPSIPKIPYLAKRGTSYILLESGELGVADRVSIDTHLNWVKIILSSLHKSPYKKFIPTFDTVSFEKFINQDLTAKNILWYSPTSYVSGKIPIT